MGKKSNLHDLYSNESSKLSDLFGDDKVPWEITVSPHTQISVKNATVTDETLIMRVHGFPKPFVLPIPIGYDSSIECLVRQSFFDAFGAKMDLMNPIDTRTIVRNFGHIKRIRKHHTAYVWHETKERRAVQTISRAFNAYRKRRRSVIRLPNQLHQKTPIVRDIRLSKKTPIVRDIRLSKKNPLIRDIRLRKKTPIVRDIRLRKKPTLSRGVRLRKQNRPNLSVTTKPHPLQKLKRMVRRNTALAPLKESGSRRLQRRRTMADIRDSYSYSRDEYHTKIVKEHCLGKTINNKRPRAVFMLGTPGGGKDTCLHNGQFKSGHVEINVDDCLAAIPSYWDAIVALSNNLEKSGEDWVSMFRGESKKIAYQLLERVLENKMHFIWNGTGKNVKRYFKLMKRVRKLGYVVELFGVHVPFRIACQRVLKREKKTGRFVPVRVIKRAFERMPTNFEILAAESDYARLWLTTELTPSLIWSKHQGVLNQAMYDDWKKHRKARKIWRYQNLPSPKCYLSTESAGSPKDVKTLSSNKK